MRIIASAAITADGYMDDCSSERLVLSDTKDWQEVHELRAKCDAILVGAETIRRDNPALLIRSEELKTQRIAAGKHKDITKVTISNSGNISAESRFFTEGTEVAKIVIVGPKADKSNIVALSAVSRVIRLDDMSAHSIYNALSSVGIETLMIEGGAQTLKTFIDADMIDEFRLAVSPFKLSDISKRGLCDTVKAPRLPYFDNLPFETTALRKDSTVGRMSVRYYTINPQATQADITLLQRAIDISERSKPTDTAYRVGCVLAVSDGSLFEGYTHETSPTNHAEEEAIAKAIAAAKDLSRASIYTSMEPCSTRASKPVSCSQLILQSGISRVVYAYAEPDCFVKCEGTALLRRAGIEVSIVRELAQQVADINAHIISGNCKK